MRSLPFTVDRVVMRVSANLADKVRDALRASLNVNEIVDAFLNTYREGTVTRSQARNWARINVKQNDTALTDALDAVWASGWILGTDYATEAMRIASIKKAPTFSIDWSKWKPGQPAAEALVRPPRGLKRLLAKHRNQTIKGISDTNLDRIGTVLADGLAVGADRRSIARDIMTLGIEGIMGDAKRAMTIALTETSRAVGAATLERYQEMGLRFHEWLTVEGEGVCVACDENALAGPVSVGSEFPSGDLSEPAHPNCRCKMIPFIENFSTPVRDTVSLGATADATKGSEDQPRDENGRWTNGFATDWDSHSNTEKQFATLAEDQKEYAAYIASNDAYINAITNYASDFDYQELNDNLRADGELNPNQQDIFDNLQELLLSEDATFSRPLTLFRGMYDLNGEFDNVKVGDILTDQGFVSTTTDPSIAMTFANNLYSEQNDAVEMKIELPVGANGIALDSVVEQRFGQGAAQHTDEDGKTSYINEVLLPAGTQFEVTAVGVKDERSGVRRVDVKVVGNDYFSD